MKLRNGYRSNMARWLACLMVFCTFSLSQSRTVHEQELQRFRRSVMQLQEMVDKVVPRGKIKGELAMHLIGYGNYCGPGGSGKVLDSIDRCCKYHDLCYGDTSRRCPQLNSYFTQYKYHFHKKEIYCGDNQSNCARILCNCDKKLTECLIPVIHKYNPALKKKGDPAK